MRRRNVIPLLIRIGLAAGLLALVFVRIDLSKFRDALAGIKPWWLVGACALYALSLVVKATRWKIIGLCHRRATVFDCFSATANGFFIALLVPVPGMFEFTRAYVMKKRARVPFGSVLAVIAAERALDTVFLLGAASAVLVVLRPAARWLSVFTLLVAVCAGVGLGALAAFVLARRTLMPRIKRALARLPVKSLGRVARILEHFAEGIAQLRALRAKEVFGALALSVGLWGARAGYVLFVARSLGFECVFGLALFVAAVEQLGTIVRLTPAGIGQYQVMIVPVLMVFGVERSLATGASLVLHAVRLLVIVVLGAPCLLREHLTVSSLRTQQEDAGANTASPGAGAAQ